MASLNNNDNNNNINNQAVDKKINTFNLNLSMDKLSRDFTEKVKLRYNSCDSGVHTSRTIGYFAPKHKFKDNDIVLPTFNLKSRFGFKLKKNKNHSTGGSKKLLLKITKYNRNNEVEYNDCKDQNIQIFNDNELNSSCPNIINFDNYRKTEDTNTSNIDDDDYNSMNIKNGKRSQKKGKTVKTVGKLNINSEVQYEEYNYVEPTNIMIIGNESNTIDTDSDNNMNFNIGEGNIDSDEEEYNRDLTNNLNINNCNNNFNSNNLSNNYNTNNNLNTSLYPDFNRSFGNFPIKDDSKPSPCFNKDDYASEPKTLKRKKSILRFLENKRKSANDEIEFD